MRLQRGSPGCEESIQHQEIWPHLVRVKPTARQMYCFPEATESQELMKRSGPMTGSKRGLKVRDPGVSQVWAVSKDTESLGIFTETLLCVNLAGKLAPHQARPDRGGEEGENLVRDFCLESAQLHLQMETVEGPAGKSWGRGEPGKLGRLTQAHINSDKRSDSSLFTNNSALLEFPKVILLGKH